MTMRLPAICDSCVLKHEGVNSCDAFPKGPIPLNWLRGEGHSVPRSDQPNDLVYVQDPEKVAEFEDYQKVFGSR